MKLLLIEGMPGSGKTTAARMLYEHFLSKSLDTQWHVEESKTHPVHPAWVKKRRLEAGFPQLCLSQWQTFADMSQHSETLYILEGSAFQSTIRYMMENDSIEHVHAYFAQFEAIISPLMPVFIYLRPENAMTHSHTVVDFRGDDWATKVAAYETSTPFAMNRGLEGIEGMHVLWSKYAALCDALFQQWSLPKFQLDFQAGNYSRHQQQILSLLDRL